MATDTQEKDEGDARNLLSSARDGKLQHADGYSLWPPLNRYSTAKIAMATHEGKQHAV